MNVLISDLYRLVKDKTLYIFMAILAALSVVMCLIYYYIGSLSDTFSSLGDVVMHCVGLEILGTLTGIFISLFNGKEYTNNTIRNKICCGENRFKLYFIKLAENCGIAVLFFAVAAVVALIVGAFMFDAGFSEGFAAKFFCQLLLLVAFTSVITCIINTTKSTKAPLIITVALFVLLNAFSYMLPQLSTNAVIYGLCRCIYMVVSTMMLSSENGLYTVTTGQLADGEYVRQTIEYGNLYVNAIVLSAVYIALSVLIALPVIRKLNYK